MLIAKIKLAKIILTVALEASASFDGQYTTQKALNAAPWVRESNPIVRTLNPRGLGMFAPNLEVSIPALILWKLKPDTPVKKFLYRSAVAYSFITITEHTCAGINNIEVARREGNRYRYACSLGWSPSVSTGWRCP